MQKLKSFGQQALVIAGNIYRIARILDVGMRLARFIGWVDDF